MNSSAFAFELGTNVFSFADLYYGFHVILVYYVGPHGWEPMLYDDVLNAGLYNPISVHSVDQEEPTNEDREWMDRLQSLEKYQKQVLPSV
ncbi:unnamed protein product [Cuscuta campestris]|uniref:Uncharacterized protein n=1 Tax=Cuscuta campestris TaxID=132261 RepID=A0A484N9X3_9ASTE|nr:unnamed protein product [Cuscuta campestris]